MKNFMCLLVGLIFSGIGMAQWSKDPSENLKLNDRDLYDFELATLEDGSSFVVYNGPNNGHNLTSVLYLDKNGNFIWDKELLVSDEAFPGWTQVNQLKATDKDGNLILSVADCRHHSGPTTYTAYKINTKGEFVWSRDGISLNKDFTGLNHSMCIVALADGSVVFGWSEKADDDQFGYIRMQRISADGKKLWGEEGKRIASDRDNIENPVFVGADNNEFVVLYSKGTYRSLYAEKLDFDATSVWGQEVLVANGASFPNYPIHTVISAIPADGGIIVSWVDVRYGNDNKVNCVAFIDAQGEHLYPQGAEGLELGSPVASTAQLVFNPINKNLLACWVSEGRAIAQLVNIRGDFLWDSEGKEIISSENQIGYLRTQMAENDVYGVFCMTNNFGNVTIYATLLDADGNYLWNPQKVSVSTHASGKSDLTVGEYRNGQWVLVWDDERLKQENSGQSLGHRLFAQNIGRQGLLGVQPVSNLETKQVENFLSISPNPISGPAHIHFSTPRDGNAEISLKDLQGKTIQQIYNGRVCAGQNHIVWENGQQLSSGMYLLQYQSGNNSHIAKIIIR